MAEKHVGTVMGQRIIMKFFVKEGGKPSEIHHRISLQYGEATVSKSTLYEWCKQFRDRRELMTSPTPKKFRARPSAGKVMGSVFLDFRGFIHVDYLPKGHTINAAYYQKVLKDVHAAIKRKRPGLITRGVIFQQDNARPHTAQITMAVISQLGWEVIPHPPHRPDLAPSDFHLFGPSKNTLVARTLRLMRE